MKRILSDPIYITNYGKAYLGNALDLLSCLDDESIDLVVTSPPFALQRKKEYGNKDQNEYVEWLLQFAEPIKRILKDTGSFVLDLGGAYRKGLPVRSLYNYRILIRFCDEMGFSLAEEFFWYNPAKLPSPIEWVNKRKIRVKDAVNTIWWLSKTEFPKANVKNVLLPYSDRMKLLLKDSEAFYKPKMRPSGHDISNNFNTSNGGSIPPNLIQLSNTESNSQYLRYCKIVGATPHPARFPVKLPEFFIKFLTDPEDTVLDIFAGSNASGMAAETNYRKWIGFEERRDYIASSALRFVETASMSELKSVYDKLNSDESNVRLPQESKMLFSEVLSVRQ